MNLVHETLRYVGMGYFGLPDEERDLQLTMDKAHLYYRWGSQSGRKGDFAQAFEAYGSLPDEKLVKPEKVLEKYEHLLEIGLDLLRLELKEAAAGFGFLSENRLRIELREISFPSELEARMGGYMDKEEKLQTRLDEIKNSFMQIALGEEHKERRKRALEHFEGERRAVNQGIDAFYGRVREYVASS